MKLVQLIGYGGMVFNDGLCHCLMEISILGCNILGFNMQEGSFFTSLLLEDFVFEELFTCGSKVIFLGVVIMENLDEEV